MNTYHYRRHATHSLLFFFTCLIIALVLITIAGSPAKIHAQSIIDVTAKVDAPLPTDPAIITSPSDQQHFATPSITVSGTCGNGAYVTLIRNGIASGTAGCVGGLFTFQTDLSPGANQLQVKVFNSTDNEGSASPAITVYYDIPQPQPTSPSEASISPLLINTQGGMVDRSRILSPGILILYTPETYRTYTINEQWKSHIAVIGGTGPYTVGLDWKDTSTTRYIQENSERFEIEHTYSHPENYQPIISAVDSSGNRASLQIFIPVVGIQTADTQIRESLSFSLLMIALIILVLFAVAIAELAIMVRSLRGNTDPPQKD